MFIEDTAPIFILSLLLDNGTNEGEWAVWGAFTDITEADKVAVKMKAKMTAVQGFDVTRFTLNDRVAL